MNQITFISGTIQRLQKACKATAMAALLLVSFLGNAQTWDYLGDQTGVSAGGASYINFAKGPSGVINMSYYDTSVSKGSVQQYNGTAWSYLGGSAGITTSFATYNSVSADANGNVYYTNQGTGMEAHMFNGTAWSVLPSVTTTTVNYQASVVSSNGILIATNGEASGTAKRYVNGAWQQLGATGFAGGTPTYLHMVAGNDGVVYACFNNSGNVHVYKIADNATATDAWTAVGTANVGAAAGSENYNSSIAIDQNNNLYVAYMSGSAGGNKLNVKKYDGSAWTQLGSENFSPGRTQHVSIAVTPAGMPYVVASNWEDADFLKNFVMAYNAGTNTWAQLGTGYISGGQATYNALTTDSSGNLILAYADNAAGKIIARKYIVADVPVVTPTAVAVTTQGGIPATITTSGGTLQLLAAVTPATASQSVTWSITSGSEFATVDANGLVTATASGAVTVRATSANATVYGELTVVVTIPPTCPSLTSLYENFDTLSCCAMGVVPTCWNSILLGGASQIISGTQPASGTSQIYQNGYGAGKISIVVLPQFSNVNAGTHQFRFKAKANSTGLLEFGYITDVNDATTFVILQSITITNSSYNSTDAERIFAVPTTVPANARLALRNPGTTFAGMYWDDVYWEPAPVVTAVQITTQNNVPATITTNGGTLQLVATVTPVAEAVTWTISAGAGFATINDDGLVTATANGTATITATTLSGATATFNVVITSQTILATAIEITTLNNVAATITANNGTLQLVATITPANSTDTTVVWSITSGAEFATIDANGLVTALDNGTITVTATTANGTVIDTLDVVITNQTVLATAIEITTLNNVAATITTNAGMLQLVAAITPANSTDTTVVWSITSGTGLATIDANGLVTALANGTITVTATTANGLTDTIEIIITNQVIQVTALTITTANNAPATIVTAAGTLQLVATVTPANATDTSVVWSITSGSGFATIDANGLVTAVTNGTVTVTATSANGVTATFNVVINIPTTGVDTVTYNHVSVYPNPTNGLVNITTNQPVTFAVYNTLGQQVTAGKGNVVNLQDAQQGVYMLQITLENGAGQTVKVIKN